MRQRFVVMENVKGGDSPRYIFVRDGFSILGFVFPVIWLLWHRVWFAALAVIGLTLAFNFLGVVPTWAVASSVAVVGLGALVALEGGHWRVDALQRRGYVQITAFDAESLEEAELRFAHRQMEAPEEAETPADVPVASETKKPVPQVSVQDNDMIFATPERGA